MGYGEIKPNGGVYYSGSMLEQYKSVSRPNFQAVLIENKEDLWPAFKNFLSRNSEVSASLPAAGEKEPTTT